MNPVNIISFSLWGANPRYIIGAKRNIELARTIYPDWTCRFHIDKSITKETAKELHDMGAQVFLVDPSLGPYHGMFWRFYPASDEQVDRFISRDCDSRLNEREQAAVQDWIESGKPFHIMRDHPHHHLPIMGGMWGAVKGCIPDMVALVERYGRHTSKGLDQMFLQEIIWPRIRNNHIAHDDVHKLYGAKPWPKHPPMNFGTYVGQIFGEDDKPAEWLPY